MGRVLGPYGVKGWIKIHPFSDRVDALASYARWWLERDGRWVECAVDDCERHGDHIVARIAGCDTREQAFLYRGAHVALPRAQLPPARSGEYYQTDLIGLRLKNRDGAELGTLVAFFENGAHPIMRVDTQRGEQLIPFIPTVVDGVDMDARVVWVDWGADW
jgi:16S rRNA processing protein RimM